MKYSYKNAKNHDLYQRSIKIRGGRMPGTLAGAAGRGAERSRAFKARPGGKNRKDPPSGGS